MDPSTWNRVKDICADALALDAGAREGLITERCGGDAVVEREVRRLVAAHERAEPGFLATPTGGPLSLAAPPDADRRTGGWEQAAGDRVGPYALRRLLGHGGMGTVWEAERVEGGFEQRVAIKFLRYLAPGSDAERRFVLEREILGKLQHPGIAGILDAGRTELGVPYLVMEFVAGRRIDRYCDEERLDVGQRVRLAAEVCRIVARAHGSLVVHRDLKPANILVTEEGEPRLLDFGIAKLLEPEPEQADLTVEGFAPMTPDYASPEQIRGQSVTTASDVYSMGAVLYELLTGRTPFRRPTASGLDLERSIVEDAPTPPSRGSQVAAERMSADERRAILEARNLSSHAQLRRALAGELDMIVLQALRVDPERRYRGMDALADDLDRWLDGYPVRARPDSLGYRFSKYVRRNWLPLAAAALVFLAIAAGGGIAVWQAREARLQRDRADDNAQRTEQVNRFLVDLLAAPGGRWWRDQENKGPETRVIDVLDEAAARLETDLEDAPLQRAALHQTLADTYMTLGMRERTEHQVRRALEIRTRELGEVHPSVAESTYYLAITVRGRGRLADAVEVYKRAIAIERQLAESTANYPFALIEGAAAAARLGLHGLAAEWSEEAVAVTARGARAPTRVYMLIVRTLLRAERGDLRSAEQGLGEVRAAIREAEAAWGDPTGMNRQAAGAATLAAWLAGDLDRAQELSALPEGTRPTQWRAQVLFDLGRPEEALEFLDRLDAEVMQMPEMQTLLARVVWATDRDPERCLTIAEPALATEEGRSRGLTLYLAEARSATAECLLARGRPGDAERAHELATAARAMLDELFDRPTPLHRRLPIVERRSAGG